MSSFHPTFRPLNEVIELNEIGLNPSETQTLYQKFYSICGSQTECFMTKDKFADFIEAETGGQLIGSKDSNSNSKYFNARLFSMIDAEKTGKIRFNDFRDFVLQYRGKTVRKKLDFLFNLYDMDGDGTLNKYELREMLKASMQEDKVYLEDETIDSLASTLLDEAHGEGSSEDSHVSLNKEDLYHLFQSHGELLENMSTIVEKWLQPVKATKQNWKEGKTPKSFNRAKKWIQNNSVFCWWLGFYVLTNLVLFISKYLLFTNEEETKTKSKYLAIARACGWCLDLNCGFVLIAMMRHALTRLRSTWLHRILPIDDHRFFHELCGICIAAFGFLHMVMHLLNIHVVVQDPLQNATWTYSEYLFSMKSGENSQLGLIPGFAYISGFVLVFILSVMVICTLPYFRHNGYFHVFYISHRVCYPIFFLFLILHCKDFYKWFIVPGGLFIIEQIFRTYYNYFGFKTTVKTGITLPPKVTNLVIRRPPGFEFSSGDYIFINIPKISRSEWHPFTISSAPENRSEITLHIGKSGPWTTNLYEHFNYINKRERMQITRPGTENGSIIQSRGNADRSSKSLQKTLSSKSQYAHLRKRPIYVKLAKPGSESNGRIRDATIPEHSVPPAFVSQFSRTESISNGPVHDDSPFTVYIDGPYGAPSSDIVHAEHAVLIGAGIGVTPFASILQSLMYRHLKSKLSCPSCQYKFTHGFEDEINRLKKVDFYWINRDQKDFEWFTNLLSKLEIEQNELGGQMERFLDIHMYMTKALPRTDMRAVALQLAFDLQYEKSKRDLLAGLKSRLRSGRPDWEQIFKKLDEEKKGNVVVFFCGNPQLGNQLNSLCIKYKFIFKTEKF